VRNEDAARALERRSDRFLLALTPLAALAAATWVRNEVYLLVNRHGFASIRPEHVEAAFCVVVALWCVARALRGPRTAGVSAADVSADGRLDLERAIGRFTFPWIVVGTVAMMRFTLSHGPSPDFLEPANAGLMIQQWVDFGRLPFLETFGAHGLYDSLFGFAYVTLNGTHDLTWTLYDYLIHVITALVSFHVLRAWW
jgi:hypothetical protein